MKLQYLGDSRDAFKWDLLHFICSHPRSELNRLIYVPMLTPDDAKPIDGKTHHSRFPVRTELTSFIKGLGRSPRSLRRITQLGQLAGGDFPVRIEPGEAHIEKGRARNDYWKGWSSSGQARSLIFFDPDNGFETKTQTSAKWVRHDELALFVNDLPESSAIVVYQHRPRRTWSNLFADLRGAIIYSKCVLAVHEANLAFVFLTKTGAKAGQLDRVIADYCGHHPHVCRSRIR